MNTNTKSTVSTPQQSSRLAAAPNRDEVQERAYFRYVERGRIDGKAVDDWLIAETELRQKPGSQGDA
jgi:hypothetical protein